MGLNHEEKKELLGMARRALEAYLASGKFVAISPAHSTLLRTGGAFVTLESEEDLRGCIGRMSADKPLSLTVQEMAIQAAIGDPRFPSVGRDELDRIVIEISALSPLRVLQQDRLGDIDVGRHGLVISRGSRRGVLLPQVAEREGWNREQFLSATCRKAGLPQDAWKDPSSVIEIFTADVFSERDPSP